MSCRGHLHLCADQGLRVVSVQAEHEAYGVEELVDADPEGLLVQPTGGSRVERTRLNYELEQVLQSLERTGEEELRAK